LEGIFPLLDLIERIEGVRQTFAPSLAALYEGAICAHFEVVTAQLTPVEQVTLRLQEPMSVTAKIAEIRRLVNSRSEDSASRG
jgi:hypothetical protein